MKGTTERIKAALNNLRSAKPLILNITNHVTMDFVANCLHAVGAAPIISESVDELEELTEVAGAINLNIGTLNDDFMKLARATVSIATRFGKPIVFDPVGVGATKLRTDAAVELLSNTSISIIRGNSSEILDIFKAGVKSRGSKGRDVGNLERYSGSKTFGVDAAEISSTHDGVFLALAWLSDIFDNDKLTVVVSGASDFISYDGRLKKLNYGSPLMQKVTGMGCALTAVISAFAAVCEDKFEAAVLATAYFGMCGGKAAKVGKSGSKGGPGSFKSIFIDRLYSFLD